MRFYVLTRNGIVATSYLHSLRTQLDAKYKDVWKNDLAGIYLAAAYRLLKQDSEAHSIIKKVKFGEKSGEGSYSARNQLIRDSQLLYILSMHFPDRMRILKPEKPPYHCRSYFKGTL